MTVEILSNIIELIILIIAALITSKLIPFINTHIKQEKLELIMEYIMVFVRGVENIVKESGKGAEKKAHVIELVSKKANEIGIKLSIADISYLIEDAVKTMNDEKIKIEQQIKIEEETN